MAASMRALKIFYCYAHEDKALRDELEKHLGALKRLGQIVEWHDGDIQAGATWAHEIKWHLYAADIILLLISPDFIHSDYCYGIEMSQALSRNKSGEAHVIPIILRPVEWEETPIGELQVLPSTKKPITSWRNRDEAFWDVARGIRKVVKTLLTEGKQHWQNSTGSYPRPMRYEQPFRFDMNVMIGGFIRDFPEYLKEAQDACLRQGLVPTMIEQRAANDAEMIKASLELVDAADIYLGVLGDHYGDVLAGYDLSLAEIEYNRAVERNIPRLIFVARGVQSSPEVGPVESVAKLEAFKERLTNYHATHPSAVHFFESASELRDLLTDALLSYRQSDSTLFYVSDIPQPPRPYIAHPYTLLQTPDLVGRQKELNLLNDWITNPNSNMRDVRILNIAAVGGMGKSAVAWKWFNDIAPRVISPLAGRIWWSFYESDTSFDDFIKRALKYVTSLQYGLPSHANPDLDSHYWQKRIDRSLRFPRYDSEQTMLAYSHPHRHLLSWGDHFGTESIDNEHIRQTDGRAEDLLLYILDQEPFLLVFDGLERLLRAYARIDAPYLADNTFDEETIKSGRGVTNLDEDTPHSFAEQHRLRKTADPRVGVFLRKLAHVHASRILISTRLYPADLQSDTGQFVPGSSAVFLTGLEDTDAFTLWSTLGVKGSQGVLLPLFHTFDNHPLLVRVLAGEVARYRRAPGDFDAWQRTHASFNPFHLPLVQVKSHILSFALQGLDEKVGEVLSYIAAFRMSAAYDILVGVLVGEGKPLITEAELDPILTELEDRGLLGWDKRANRYDLHPLVRGVTWSKLNKDNKARIYKLLHSYLESLSMTNNWLEVHSTEQLTPAIELYNTLIGLERYDEAFELYRRNIENALLYRIGANQQRIELLQLLFPGGIDHTPSLRSPAAQAFTFNALALAYHLNGQPAQAASLHQRQIALRENEAILHDRPEQLEPYSYETDIFDEDGVRSTIVRSEESDLGATYVSYSVGYKQGETLEADENRHNISIGLCNLSQALLMSGAMHASEVAARRALSITRQTPQRLQEPLSLHYLGLILAARGMFEEAKVALKRLLWIHETLWEHQRSKRADWFYYDRWMPRSLRHTQAALAQVELWQSQVEPDQNDHSASDWLLNNPFKRSFNSLVVIDYVRIGRLNGAITLSRGDLSLADRFLTEALRQARVINYTQEELPSIIGLAEIARQQGNLSQARELLGEVWELAQRGPYPLFLADAYNVLASIERADGNIDAAIEASTQAYKLAWRDGPPFAYYIGLQQARLQLNELGASEPKLAPFDQTRYVLLPDVVLDETPPRPR